MQRSFERMRVMRMDLMRVHELLDVDVHLDTLRQWQPEGRIRYIGVTHDHAGAYGDLAKVIALERLDFLQLNDAILEREADRRRLPLAALGGRVRGDQLGPVLSEVRARPSVGNLCHSSDQRPRHLDNNLGAARGPWRDAETRRRMWQLVEALPG